VSKQAPSGEYLKTGSFMIRGKKNFIPQTALVFGLGLLYKLDDASVFRHLEDRKVKTNEEELESQMNEMNTEFEDVKIEEENEDEAEDGPQNDANKKLVEIKENEENENESVFPDTTFQMKLVSNLG
jgi:hypothetical protein